MAQFDQGAYIPSRPPYVLHVVGSEGAGKNGFIAAYFPSVPVFDLSTLLADFHALYSEDLVINTDTRTTDPMMGEFEARLLQKWNEFLRAADPATTNPDDRTSQFVVLVKSSGKNDPLTALLVWYFPTTLLIVKDDVELQAVKHAIYHTRVFHLDTRAFSGALDAPFIKASPRLTQTRKAKKISMATLEE